MEKVLAALSQPDRVGIVLWLIKHGPARQIELLELLEAERGGPVNPGTVSALLRPLLESGLLVRDRARGPIYVRDRDRTVELLQAAAAITSTRVDIDKAQAESTFDALRRAIFRVSPGAEADSSL
jgi:DNA-binding PadR family transcriptional regulator